jgi:hypothetical protein
MGKCKVWSHEKQLDAQVFPRAGLVAFFVMSPNAFLIHHGVIVPRSAVLPDGRVVVQVVQTFVNWQNCNGFARDREYALVPSLKTVKVVVGVKSSDVHSEASTGCGSSRMMLFAHLFRFEKL